MLRRRSKVARPPKHSDKSHSCPPDADFSLHVTIAQQNVGCTSHLRKHGSDHPRLLGLAPVMSLRASNLLPARRRHSNRFRSPWPAASCIPRKRLDTKRHSGLTVANSCSCSDGRCSACASGFLGGTPGDDPTCGSASPDAALTAARTEIHARIRHNIHGQETCAEDP